MDQQSTNLVVFDIPMKDIFCDQEWNCRGNVSGADVIELAKSIDTQGLLQPITLMPYNKDGFRFKIVTGHRRYLAHKQLKREKIPATVRVDLSEMDARLFNLVENLQRKSLNMMQEARGIEPFLKAGWTHQELAKKLETSTGWVSVRKQLLNLEPEIQQVAAAGLLTAQHVKDIAALPSKTLRFDTVKRIKEARIRGEKPQVPRRNKVSKDPTRKKRQLPEDIFAMIEHIADHIDYGFYTRCLAWASGEISDLDLFKDLKKECETRGLNYRMPEAYSEYRSLLV